MQFHVQKLLELFGFSRYERPPARPLYLPATEKPRVLETSRRHQGLDLPAATDVYDPDTPCTAELDRGQRSCMVTCVAECVVGLYCTISFFTSFKLLTLLTF